MQKIFCPHCKKEFELSEAFKHQIEDNILNKERIKQKEQIEIIKKEVAVATENKVKEQLEFRIKDSENVNKESKDKINNLQDQLLESTKLLRSLKDKDQQRDLEMQKTLMAEREKLQEEIGKNIKAKTDLEIAEVRKQLDDTKKALEDAQRKAAQKSQQLQGEILEIELETLLTTTFPQDDIVPVAKGVAGADIRQIVKSPRGFICGTILWESKRTKEWNDKWLDKLKEDERREKAMCSVIVSVELPKRAENGFGLLEGVWVCSQVLVIPLATILRKNILDIGYQKAISANRGEKSDLLYSYITSHEFQQQVENIIEVYRQMHNQIIKERAAYEKLWKMRESQVQRILMSTANIIGSMQGVVGASMPPIKGLELPDQNFDDPTSDLLE